MINSVSLSFFPPAPRRLSRLPSFIYRLGEQGHLRAPVRSFFLVSLLIFWEADGCRENRNPQTNTKWHHLLQHQKWIMYFMHSYPSLSHAGWTKTPSQSPVRDLCDDMRSGRVLMGGRKNPHLNHNTCFILCAIQGTSLLQTSKTPLHTEIRFLSPSFTQRLLKNAGEWPRFPISVP